MVYLESKKHIMFSRYDAFVCSLLFSWKILQKKGIQNMVQIVTSWNADSRRFQEDMGWRHMWEESDEISWWSVLVSMTWIASGYSQWMFTFLFSLFPLYIAWCKVCWLPSFAGMGMALIWLLVFLWLLVQFFSSAGMAVSVSLASWYGLYPRCKWCFSSPVKDSIFLMKMGGMPLSSKKTKATNI